METSEFRAMLDESQRHWWYRGRRRIVCDVLDSLRLPEGPRLLDAGCGSGALLTDLDRYGESWGVEPNPLGVAAAHRSGHRRIVRARVEELPFAGASFDLVTCLDVIEHTPDDGAALAELLRVTCPGGHLVVTVPAYPALWSHHDVVNGHYRRYLRQTLLDTATAAGWRPLRITHFNAFFLAPAALVRLVMRTQGERQRRSELALTPRSLDRVLELPLRVEAALLRRGVQLPAGLSLLAVLERPYAAAHPSSVAERPPPRRELGIRIG
jgi:2-polyprenyl-3-methyl-5-hydroxy-6-metoxy-1,4-benzoquinol methylase